MEPRMDAASQLDAGFKNIPLESLEILKRA